VYRAPDEERRQQAQREAEAIEAADRAAIRAMRNPFLRAPLVEPLPWPGSLARGAGIAGLLAFPFSLLLAWGPLFPSESRPYIALAGFLVGLVACSVALVAGLLAGYKVTPAHRFANGGTVMGCLGLFGLVFLFLLVVAGLGEVVLR
jgi:hypothetical protein